MRLSLTFWMWCLRSDGTTPAEKAWKCMSLSSTLVTPYLFLADGGMLWSTLTTLWLWRRITVHPPTLTKSGEQPVEDVKKCRVCGIVACKNATQGLHVELTNSTAATDSKWIASTSSTTSIIPKRCSVNAEKGGATPRAKRTGSAPVSLGIAVAMPAPAVAVAVVVPAVAVAVVVAVVEVAVEEIPKNMISRSPIKVSTLKSDQIQSEFRYPIGVSVESSEPKNPKILLNK